MTISKRQNVKKPDKPTAIDLFCGCGGLTSGLKQAGFYVLGAVELNPLAAETYRQNHQTVTVWREDIQTLDPTVLMKQLGLKKRELSLLAGCPPCQGFSQLRTKNGAHHVVDPRNDLLFEFERFVRAFLPKTLMMENVPRLANDFRFARFLEKITKLGYHGEHRILDAADFNVPQRRKRLIFLAGLNGQIPFAVPSKKHHTVRDTIAELPAAGNSGDPLHDFLSQYQPKTLEIIRNIPKDGGSRASLPERLWLKCHKRTPNGFKDVYGRMAWKSVAPTITSGCFNPSKGRFLHPEEDRAITLREAAVLQGFSPDYYFPANNRSAVGMMIGNALPPPFIAAHAKKIIKFLLENNDATI
jgi:DNA (cytosine-5)-methyltransferase 1